MAKKEVRLIDARKITNDIALYLAENAYLNDTALDALKMAARWVNEAPTIDPESLRPHGKWIECDYVKYDGHSECIHYPQAALCCSNCRNAFKKELLWKRNYCPNCGANMGVKI